MKRVYVVQPMWDRTNDEIMSVRKKARTAAMMHLKEEVEILPTYVEGGNDRPLFYLVQALKHLPYADLVVATPGWSESRGCRHEVAIALDYGIEVLKSSEA